MSDVWVPQHRGAVIWCMRTSTASQLIDWGGAGTAAEADAVLTDLDRQIAAQGRRQERDGYGHMVWVQVADSMR